MSSDALDQLILVPFALAWGFLIFIGCRNLRRAGRSPAAMWWSLLGPVPSIIVFIYSVFVLRNRPAELAREEAERQRLLARLHAAEQLEFSSRLSRLRSDSEGIADRLPALQVEADAAFHLAQHEFQDGAFAPFWDAVETTATKLVEIQESVQMLTENARAYRAEASKLDDPTPPLEIVRPDRCSATTAAERLRSMVREAQKDFQFSAIYEQRRTNQLLVAGFLTLGQAIAEIGRRLDTSFADLASTIEVGLRDLSTEVVAAQQSAKSEVVAEIVQSKESLLRRMSLGRS